MKLIVLSQHILVAEILGRHLARSGSGIELIGSADSGREGLRMAQEHGVDLAVIESRLRELNGLDTTRQLLDAFPDALVLMLSTNPETDGVAEAMEAGASGYGSMASGADELQNAIDSIRAGNKYLCPDATTALVRSKTENEEQEDDPALAFLTPREREVLQLLAEGLSSREIGDRLHISPKTVDTHRQHVMRKLESKSVADLVKYAIRAGLISL